LNLHFTYSLASYCVLLFLQLNALRSILTMGTFNLLLVATPCCSQVPPPLLTHPLFRGRTHSCLQLSPAVHEAPMDTFLNIFCAVHEITECSSKYCPVAWGWLPVPHCHVISLQQTGVGLLSHFCQVYSSLSHFRFSNY
jgi:hypothetical protein